MRLRDLATLKRIFTAIGTTFVVFFAALLLQRAAAGQSVDFATLYGTVADPTGALIPEASVHLSGPATSQDSVTDATGRFSFTVAPGSYTVSVSARDFVTFTSPRLDLKPDRRLRLPIRLAVAGRAEEISVGSDFGMSTDPNSNASASIFEGGRLSLLSDDPGTLQQQLTALAGPSLGGAGVQFIVNGFSGGRLPPKSSIRSIRINSNPYSAYYDSFGFGRVEVQTKPGSDKLHGGLNFAGTDQPFNARNPYDFGVLPPYYQFQTDGNLNGPIDKKTSFFLSENMQQLANNAVINAINPSDIGTTTSEALPAAQHTLDFSVRVDHQFSDRNFGFLRDEWTETHTTNAGIAPLVLPNSAYTANTLTNTLQASDTQALGPHGLNEARFQYIRTRVRQDPNSTAPTILVEGAFQDGGDTAQTLRDNQDHYELQDVFEFDKNNHSVRAGFRLRELREANNSAANFNGEYIYPYVTYDPVTDGPVDNSYVSGRPSQYSVTVGRPNALLWDSDLAAYAEDDWKATKNITLSYGLRVESQSAIPDHFDPSPRFGVAWAVHRRNQPVPVVTLRTGYGIFYDRFPATDILQAIRQNGTSEVAYFVQNPPYPYDPRYAPMTASQPTIYRVNPHLSSGYTQIGSIDVERALGQRGSISSKFLYAHGTHGFLSQNVNAPLPGTYNPAVPNSGVRPLGTTGNIYQYDSDSNENDEVWFTNSTFQVTPRLFVYGSYVLQRAYNESAGSSSFASNQYNVAADYARASDNRLNMVSLAGFWTLPHGFGLSFFAIGHSGAPFNITTGTDLNGDTIFNDRPAFATDLTRASVVRTRYGNFDTNPLPGQTIIPRNYGNAPGLFWLDLQASKDFHIGPRASAKAAANDPNGKPVPAAKPERLWDLKFQVEEQNLLNHNNPGMPIGVLPSPGEPVCAGITSTTACSFFGHSLSLSNEFSPMTSSNRTIFFQSFFTF